MKTEELRKAVIEKDWLAKCAPGGKWTWNEDGSVDVEGCYGIFDFEGSKIPVKIRKVSQNFHLYRTKVKTTLNFPDIIRGNIYFDDNPNLPEDKIEKYLKKMKRL